MRQVQLENHLEVEEEITHQKGESNQIKQKEDMINHFLFSFIIKIFHSNN
jgi:hypothetical protein